MRPGLIAQLVAVAAFGVAVAVVVRPLGPTFPLVLAVSQVVIVAVTQAAGLGAFLVIRSIPPSSQLKAGVSLRVPLAVGAGLKAVFVLCITVFLVALSPTFSQVADQLRLGAVWREKGRDLYVLAGSAQTDEQIASISSGDGRWGDRFGDLYPMLCDEYGAEVAKASSLDEVVRAGVAPDSLEGVTAMDVNVNYLGREQVVGVDGRPLGVSEDDGARVVLVPSTMDDDRRAATVDYARTYYDSLYQAAAVRGGEGPWDGRLKVLTYQGGRTFFTFDRRVGIDQGNRVDDPVFFVATKANVTGFERASLVSAMGLSSKLFLPVDEDGASSLKVWLDGHGFAEDDVQIERLCDVYDDASAAMGDSMALVAAALAFDALASALMANLLMVARRRRYSVEGLLGWGWCDRHRGSLVAAAVSVTVPLLALAACGAGVVSLAVGALVMALDGAIFLLLIGLSEGRGPLMFAKGA